MQTDQNKIPFQCSNGTLELSSIVTHSMRCSIYSLDALSSEAITRVLALLNSIQKICHEENNERNKVGIIINETNCIEDIHHSLRHAAVGDNS